MGDVDLGIRRRTRLRRPFRQHLVVARLRRRQRETREVTLVVGLVASPLGLQGLSMVCPIELPR